MPLANVDFGCGIAWSDEMTGGPEFVVAGGYNNLKGDVFVYSLKHNSWRRGRSNLELITTRRYVPFLDRKVIINIWWGGVRS